LEFNIPFQHKYGYITDEHKLGDIAPLTTSVLMDVFQVNLVSLSARSSSSTCGGTEPLGISGSGFYDSQKLLLLHPFHGLFAGQPGRPAPER